MVMMLARDVHEACGKYIEEGLTLKAFADTLDFNSQEMVDSVSHKAKTYPGQTQGQRKETLLLEAIDELSRGKDFERCIDLNKQLASYYESQFDYEKLSMLLSRQADLFSKIVSTERIFSEYFRVEFVGTSSARITTTSLLFTVGAYRRIFDRLWTASTIGFQKARFGWMTSAARPTAT